MANESVAPAAPAAPVVNEAIVGAPKAPVATAPVEEAPIVPVVKKKIKWGDTEKEVSFDEAVQLAQKAFGIEGKAKEAAEKAKQAESIMDMLQNNPKEFAKRCRAAGLDPQKLATEILYENIELNSLTAEQRELRELKEKQAEADALKKEEDDAIKKSDMDKKTKEWSIKFEKDLVDACTAKKIPMSRLTIALAAQYIDAGLAAKKELTINEVLPFVARDLQNIHSQTMGSLEGDALLDYLGEDLSNKVAAARVARYKTGQAQPVVAKKEPVKGPLPEAITKLKGKAYWKALRQQKTEAGIGAFPGQD
jgi:hypothetical protein